jgi:hypothetical protein
VTTNDCGEPRSPSGASEPPRTERRSLAERRRDNFAGGAKAMRIQSTIGWNEEWLRKVVAYCCRVLEYSQANVNTAFFSLAHSSLYVLV